MGRPSIVQKLNDFLLRHQPLDEEAHVVYVLVETRKLLEMDELKADFPILNFYADWALHPVKSRNMRSIEQTARSLYESARRKIISHPHEWDDAERDDLVSFIYMDQLRSELGHAFARYGIADPLIGDGVWNTFLILLIKVLEEQPIVEPIPEIVDIKFELAAPRCGHLRINFSEPIGEAPYYELRNVFG